MDNQISMTGEAEEKVKAVFKFISRMEDAVNSGGVPMGISEHVKTCHTYAKRYVGTEFQQGALTLLVLMMTNKQSFRYIMERMLDIIDVLEANHARGQSEKN